MLALDVDVAVVLNIELDHHATYGGSLAGLHAAFDEFRRHAPRRRRRAGARARGRPHVQPARPTPRCRRLALHLARARGRPAGPRRAQRAQRRRGAGGDRGRRGRRPGPRPSPRWRPSRARGGASSASARPRPEPRSSTTTPTTRPRSPRRSPPRARCSPRRLVAVFQPHLFSRTAELHREFGAALAQADVAVALDVYPARERQEDFPGITGRLIAESAADHGAGRPVFWLPTLDDRRDRPGAPPARRRPRPGHGRGRRRQARPRARRRHCRSSPS